MSLQVQLIFGRLPFRKFCPPGEALPRKFVAMSRYSLSRIDRVAQMSAQEEIIARKKLEILEKQKTAELAKQVVAAQAAANKPSKKEKAASIANAA